MKTPAGVEVRFRDGTRKEFLDQGENNNLFRYRAELGWFHITVMTRDGFSDGYLHTLDVESYPSERIDLVSHIYRTGP